MEKKIGIANLKKVAKVAIDFGNLGDKMGHETNWAARIGHMTMMLPSLMTLSGIEWTFIDDEVKDLDPAEREELIKFFKEELDLVDDELEGVIEDFMSIVNSTVCLIVTSIKLVNRK